MDVDAGGELSSILCNRCWLALSNKGNKLLDCDKIVNISSRFPLSVMVNFFVSEDTCTSYLRVPSLPDEITLENIIEATEQVKKMIRHEIVTQIRVSSIKAVIVPEGVKEEEGI